MKNHTLSVTSFRIMCEDDATADFETGAFDSDGLEAAKLELEEARQNYPQHDFYLIAELHV